MNIKQFNWREIKTSDILIAAAMVVLIILAWTASNFEYNTITYKNKLPIFGVSSDVIVSPSAIKSGKSIAKVSGIISVMREKEKDVKLAIDQKSVILINPIAKQVEKTAIKSATTKPAVPIAAKIIPPTLLGQAMPAYPSKAVEEEIEGVTFLKILVSNKGLVKEILIEQTSGYDILDISAVSAAKSWKFSPAKQGNRAVESWFKIPIKFQLKSS